MDAQNIRLTSLAHGGGCGCKLAPSVLQQLLADHPAASPYRQLLVGVDTGDDAAVWELDDGTCVIATTDFFMPVVDDPYDFGRIAATNAISDVYAMGGKPIMALALVGMPIDKLSPEIIGRILAGGESVCGEAGIPIAGGHSIDSVEPIYGLVVLGLVHPDKVKKNSDAKAGDKLVLGKPLGVGVLAAAVKKDKIDDEDYRELIANTTQLNTPGASLSGLDGVHALTDVTGFGLLGHTLELCRGAGLGARLSMRDVPLLPRVKAMAAEGFVTGASGRNWASYGREVELGPNITPVEKALLTDPQTSGGLLVSCVKEAVPDVLSIFRRDDFAHAAVIGEMTFGRPLVAVE